MTSPQLKLRKQMELLFQIFALVCLLVATIALLSLILDLAVRGVPRLSEQFLTSFPSRFPHKAGILSAWVGSIAVISVTALIAIPVGIAAGVYLEEYAKKNWLTAFIEINIINLAGIPSITFGLMALGIFVYKFKFGNSILTAGLTLALLILPIVIVTTREALRTIPSMIKEAAYAVGASRWQMIQNHLLPYSTGGILTGVIIALSRAIGETAPLITIGALTFIAFLPQSIWDPFTVLPIQMFNWVSRPQEEFHVNAAATGVVLLVLTLLLNLIAILIRYRFRKKIKW